MIKVIEDCYRVMLEVDDIDRLAETEYDKVDMTKLSEQRVSKS